MKTQTSHTPFRKHIKFSALGLLIITGLAPSAFAQPRPEPARDLVEQGWAEQGWAEQGWTEVGHVTTHKVESAGGSAFMVLEDGTVLESKRPANENMPESLLKAVRQMSKSGGSPNLTFGASTGAGLGPISSENFGSLSPGDPLGVVLGNQDDRDVVDSQALLTGYPMRTIGSFSGSSIGGTACTGTLVGPRHVLTAAHCLYNADGWFYQKSPAYFSPGQMGNGVTPNGPPRRAVQFYARLWNNKSWDYGLVILEDEKRTAQLGWMGMGWFTPIDHYTNQRARNNGYPLSGQTCADSPLPSGKCGGFMYTDTCDIAYAAEGYLMYDCDTSGGHSGSPIWHNWGAEPVVLGINKRGNEPKSNAEIVADPATLNLGPRMRSVMWNDICDWMKEWPSAFASHSLCSP